MLNLQKAPFKFSCVERRMNIYLIIFFFALLAMALSSALFQYMWMDDEVDFWPLYSKGLPNGGGDRLLLVLKTMTSFILLYNYIIPISLYVTLEMQKFTGALLIGWDVDMADPDTGEAAQARTSGESLFVSTGRVRAVERLMIVYSPLPSPPEVVRVKPNRVFLPLPFCCVFRLSLF